jgi:hypothetical protein
LPSLLALADRNVPISVALPKVAKASTIVTVVCRFTGIFTLNSFSMGDVLSLGLSMSEDLTINHRDKTRVHMPAKMFPRFKLLCWLFMGPTLGFDTKQRNSFLIEFGAFYNKNKKMLTIFFTLNMRKSHFNDEFLM